jgi:hypothetical protein
VGSQILRYAAPFTWLIAWFVGSIVYRSLSGKRVFPRAPDDATFKEAWRSGRSLTGLLGRLGGARNCLLIYVADGELTITPLFPFTLMFLPEVYSLQMQAPARAVSVARTRGLMGTGLRLSIEGDPGPRFEIWLKDPDAFEAALRRD